ANPLADHPTCRLVRFALLETEDAVRWGSAALAAVDAVPNETASEGEREGEGEGGNDATRAAAWAAHLRAYLAAAGGVAGGVVGDVPNPESSSGQASGDAVLPTPRSRAPFVPDFHPRRDARFGGRYNFEFAPHVVYNMPGVPADERNLALLC